MHTLNINILDFVEIACEPLIIENSYFTVVSGWYDDYVNVSCLPGYWLSRDVFHVTFICDTNGKWLSEDGNNSSLTCLGNEQFANNNNSTKSIGLD